MNSRIIFSETYVPVRVWLMDTVHEVGMLGDDNFRFVPTGLIETLLRQFGKEPRIVETVMFVVAHNKTNNTYDGVAMLTDDSKKERYEVRKLLEGLDKDDVHFNMRLNEIRMTYDPSWRGKRQNATEFTATTYEEMLSALEEKGRKAQFLNIVENQNTKHRSAFDVFEDGIGSVDMIRAERHPSHPSAISTAPPVKLPVQSQDKTERVELTKNGKIPARKRAALVKKYGETNIADLEARIATRLNLKN